MRRNPLVLIVACLLTLPLVQAAAAEEARISGPLVHENLAIYLVHGSAAVGAVPLTLQDAMASGQVKVRETGSVNELTIENVGDREVFVQAGDIVKGGRQDRVLSVDLVLPPHSGAVGIAAFCVEHGRWVARGSEDPALFSSAGSAMPSHEAKLAMRTFAGSGAALGGGRSGHSARPAITAESQAAIWDTVSRTQQSLTRSVGASVAAPASPSSLQLALENNNLKEAQEAYITALQGAGKSADDVVGYVFAINGKISGGDVYASHALFQKMWAKLLAANVTEAISQKNGPAAASPSRSDVESFLAATAAARETEHTLNGNVRLATRDAGNAFFAESRRADGSWVHKNYLAR